MADRTRTTLLVILGATAIACAGAVAVASFCGRISELKGRIAEYDRQTARFGIQREEGGSAGTAVQEQSLADIKAAIGAERARYYSANEVSASQFAEQIQRELLTAGLTVMRYRPVEADANTARNLTSVEFVIRGSARAFLSFLRAGTAKKHYRYFSSVAVRAKGSGGNVDATFRVGYEEKILDSSK